MNCYEDLVVHDRTDLSDFLVHLTKNNDVLVSILNDGTLFAEKPNCYIKYQVSNDVRNKSVKEQFKNVSFTETPIDNIKNLIHKNEKLGPYGIAFDKEKLASKGVNPCIYFYKENDRLRNHIHKIRDEFISKIKLLNEIPKNSELMNELHFLILLNKIDNDYSFEREWRHLGDFKFEFDDIKFIFTYNKTSLLKELENQLDKNKFEIINKKKFYDPYNMHTKIFHEKYDGIKD